MSTTGGAERASDPKRVGAEGGPVAVKLASVACARMDTATRHDARAILGAFLGSDAHYLASSGAYGDGGPQALDRALDLFLARPEVGFVWLAHAGEAGTRTPVGACVVCYAISTSRGSLVAKLDDVHVAAGWQGQGVGGAMLVALFDALRREGVARIDCACHRDNVGAWRFYEQLGFRPLDEERIALLI
jgi:ribosomal protein S18 acetylase RimI-like enzyme